MWFVPKKRHQSLHRPVNSYYFALFDEFACYSSCAPPNSQSQITGPRKCPVLAMTFYQLADPLIRSIFYDFDSNFQTNLVCFWLPLPYTRSFRHSFYSLPSLSSCEKAEYRGAAILSISGLFSKIASDFAIRKNLSTSIPHTSSPTSQARLSFKFCCFSTYFANNSAKYLSFSA